MTNAAITGWRVGYVPRLVVGGAIVTKKYISLMEAAADFANNQCGIDDYRDAREAYDRGELRLGRSTTTV